VSFGPDTDLLSDVRARVDEHFAATGGTRRGGTALSVKAAVMVAWLVASYVFLVFVASMWWQAVAGSVSLAFALAGVGFNIQHDGNHGAFSERRWMNRLAGFSVDVMGGSSYLWRYAHNVLHHRYTNIAGADEDIDTSGVVRLSPAQPWRPIYRYQHVYLWAVSSLFAIKWHLVADWRQLRTGRVGPHAFPAPSRRDLVVLYAGKVITYGLAFAVPLLVHPWYLVLAGYLGTVMLLGVLLITIFSLAHLGDAAAHPTAGPGDVLPDEWAAFQVATTVDFAQQNGLVTWYLGGLNFQIEHHLFPRVSHTNYPALAPIVRAAAERHGVGYTAIPTLREALASRQRFLKAMGERPAGAR
jgi:linoleoyl-CoA desaturase